MKKLLWVLALTGAACHQQGAPATAVTAAADPAAAPAPVRLVASAAPPSAVPAPAGPLTPELRALLQRCDLAPLLQTVRQGATDFNSHAQNGFFGRDHYRIEVALTEVFRDPAQPTVYHLKGKDRYKGTITPFVGTFTVTQVVEQPTDPSTSAEAQKAGNEQQPEPTLYTAVGDFELREDSTRRGAGVFRGHVALDWRLDTDGDVQQQSRTSETLTQGGDIKFEGTWTNSTTHRTYPVVWVEDIFSYAEAQHVLSEFAIGERDVDFNPKYAKLGWNSYWKNDEWWADGGKATVGL